MFDDNRTWVFALMAAIQVVGIASIFLSRLAIGGWTQRLFFTALILVGGLTMFTTLFSSGYWLSCSATLGCMAVGATLDLGRCRPVSSY